MRKTLLTAALGLLCTTGFAQYITEAPAGGFDFSKGKDYIVLYAPADQETAIGDKMLTNQNLDPNMVKNQFYYWTAEWDAKLFTLYDIEDTQDNSYGGSNKLNMTPLYAWGAGHFGAKSQKYDFSSITDEHILHIGFMNIGSATASNNFKFIFGPGGDNGFSLVVNKELGTPVGTLVGVGMAPDLNKWYYLDIPVKDLVDEDGDFGFEYDFSSPMTIAFNAGFEGATPSKFNKGPVDPDTGMYSITITQKGSAMAIDGVFLYKADGSAGINDLKVTKKNNDAIYNLAGQQVSKNYKGVVIKNGHKFIQ